MPTIPDVAAPLYEGVIYACDLRPGDLLGYDGAFRLVSVEYGIPETHRHLADQAAGYIVPVTLTMIDLRTMTVEVDVCGRKTAVNRIAGTPGVPGPID